MGTFVRKAWPLWWVMAVVGWGLFGVSGAVDGDPIAGASGALAAFGAFVSGLAWRRHERRDITR
jgi:membrane associated rhomboid family serine protease